MGIITAEISCKSQFRSALRRCFGTRVTQTRAVDRHTPLLLLAMSRRRSWTTWQVLQVAMPMLPVPLGCFFLYKALKSFNRSPPPIATDSGTVLSRPLYQEPVYQGIDFSPSKMARNARGRGM